MFWFFHKNAVRIIVHSKITGETDTLTLTLYRQIVSQQILPNGEIIQTTAAASAAAVSTVNNNPDLNKLRDKAKNYRTEYQSKRK